MESVQEFCKRTGTTKQRVSLWIQRGDLIAEKKGGVWVLLGLQAKPKPKTRGKSTKVKRRLGILKQYDKAGNYIKSYKTIREAGKAIGCCPSGIGRAVDSLTKSAGGFIWKRCEKITKSIDK